MPGPPPSEPTAAPPAESRGFADRVARTDPSALRAHSIEVLELNVGLRCSLSCAHCHQSASPHRTERMTPGVFARTVRLAERLKPGLVDLTGGAPELHPDIRHYVAELRDRGFAVQLRTNLVSLQEPEAVGLAEILAARRVRLLASLPGTDRARVDEQRGPGTWVRSMESLGVLARLGYGDGRLPLDLAVNPTGLRLPDDSGELEREMRTVLGRLGVSFGRLVVIANVPVGRHRRMLDRAGRTGSYLALLRAGFNSATVPLLRCRRGLTVAWDGTLWDCDFNLGAAVRPAHGVPSTIRDPRADERLATRRIAFADHCLACTAGSGSS